MYIQKLKYPVLLLYLFFLGCGEAPKERPETPQATVTRDSLKEATKVTQEKDSTSMEVAEKPFELTEENAIDFFFDYQKGLPTTRVKLTTSLGSFTVELYDNVPYHKANFIYLTKKGYFNNTMFHRVVKDFIIQGGNADNLETARKRKEIGRYLLPPDTRKGHRHHRGTISMPSSEIDNPHMLASPYEFFIVVTDPGSYHLDGNYTPFGRVVEGMDVVDLINQQPVDDGDWPSKNIYIKKAEILK
ncbi:Peptidyl-prolyl cis-trans isomerase (rotamase)-cyclophilin family [Muriicola jejuensis]|uniref:Peptidyl-prolyl cis-trans isomerase n=1 Tax=Muriicola jejuensis TaxID=504488 RepID=A0A6P0UAP1_9FLAO|nr:peptidylprolyl isomerase [Muriicola jejuensis]NER08989.1 peptidylprolyl isomerase [Muriicola jejuensis]SMP12489.1 Peptidyl-prolyl cis-trans isomerase (rotamase)-cyclophilin family [Muriicola jejuensis]